MDIGWNMNADIWIGYWPSKRNLAWSLRAIVDWIFEMSRNGNLVLICFEKKAT
jgi:hypothetical protein